MEKLVFDDGTWYSWEEFLKISGLKNRKSIYDWVNSGKAEMKKIGSASFFKLKGVA